jgi:cytochrome b6-f complex iron-sulfur subunit
MTRRDLIQKVVFGGATLIILPPVLNSCTKADTVDGGTGGNITIDLTNPGFSALNTAGGSAIIQGIIVANKGDGSFLALDSVCTHQGCTIGYNLALNNFPCPCHGSVFSASGSVVNGPAATPLKSYQVSKSGNILTISG